MKEEPICLWGIDLFVWVVDLFSRSRFVYEESIYLFIWSRFFYGESFCLCEESTCLVKGRFDYEESTRLERGVDLFMRSRFVCL